MIVPRPLKKVREKITPFSQEDKIPTFNLGSGTADSTTVLHGDGTWQPEAEGLPPGGTAGQLLAKESDTNYDVTWVDQAPAASYTSVLKHTVKAGENLIKGQAVYVSSADGTNMVVSKASNTTEATSSKTMGLIAQNLSTNGKGFVITEGLLDGLNTGSTVAGAPVWLGVNGELIYGLVGKPYAPAHLVFIGIVTRANNSNGEIFVKVQNGFELDELHDVDLKSILPTDGQVLQFDGATGLWRNNTLSTGLTVGSTAISSGTNGRVLFQNGGVLQQSANLFWDNANGRLGIGTSTPSEKLHVFGGAATIRIDSTTNESALKYNNSTTTAVIKLANNDLKIELGGSEVLRILADGKVGIGTATPSAKLDVRAQGALSTDIAFRVRNSANTVDLFNVAGNGRLSHSSNSFTGILTSEFNADNQYVINHSGIGQVWRYGPTNVISTEQNLQVNRGARFGYTVAAVLRALQINNFPVQSSGTINAIGIDINPIINNTGTYSGITWGLYYRPTLTSLTGTTHRAIETVSGDVIFGSTSGNVGIGTTSPTARLDVSAQGALSTDLAFRVRNSANTADLFSIAGNGTARVSGLISTTGGLTSTGGLLSQQTGANSGRMSLVNLRNTGGAFLSGVGTSMAIAFTNRESGAVWSDDFIELKVFNNGVGTTTTGYNFYTHNNQAYLTASALAMSINGGSIGVGIESPNASAKMQIDSSTQGFLPPRMTNAQRTAIASPAVGLMVYCTDLVEGLYVYKSMGWTFVI